MNDHDALEAELGALQPHAASPSLRQRIAEQLKTDVSAPTRSRRNRAWWSRAMTGGLVAACVAASLLLLLRPTRRTQEIESPLAAPQLSLAAAFDDSLPTVWTYRRALFRSPQDLEMLLDKHAAAATSNTPVAPRHLFIQSDTQWPFQGEL